MTNYIPIDVICANLHRDTLISRDEYDRLRNSQREVVMMNPRNDAAMEKLAQRLVEELANMI